MMKIIPNGTEVLIFKYIREWDKEDDDNCIKGIIQTSKTSNDLSYHGSSWYEQIYEVLGEDGKIYRGCYGRGLIGKSYFRTIDDHINVLKSIITDNEQEILNLQEQNESELTKKLTPQKNIENKKGEKEMAEKEIKKLPLNDEFSQCMRKLRIYPNEITEARKEEIRKCNHLFVKLRNGEESYGCHSTDYYKDADEVECVHCGLTNRFNTIEAILEPDYIEYSKTFRGILPSLTRYNKKTLESKIFEEIFKNSYLRGGKSFYNSSINLISEECLLTYHPGLLYRLALQINTSGNEKEIFEIMKQLHMLETNQEKIRLQTEEQAIELLNRYCISKPKCLTLKK